jgi:hypothetical protein
MDETTPRWNLETAEKRVVALNALLRGWSGYFNQGRVIQAYRVIQKYTRRRLQRWLLRRQGKRGTGYRQYSNEYLGMLRKSRLDVMSRFLCRNESPTRAGCLGGLRSDFERLDRCNALASRSS